MTWALPRPEPTNLIAPCPGDVAPEAARVIDSARRSRPGLRVIAEPDDVPDLCWCRVVETDEGETPAVIWAEPDASTGWVVGAETLLRPDDPVASMADLVRLLLDGCPDAPALLDVNTSSWYRRENLIALLGDEELEPPADLLWVVHVVRDEAGDGPAWLHTHGLWRCGRPELEMLDVPPAQLATAIELVNRVADLLLEGEPPAPGAPLEIGPGLRLTLQPWQEVARFVATGAPGAESTRDDVHRGVRAALCAERELGSFRPVWTWPGAVVRRLAADDATIYQSGRATRRHACLAQRAWPHLEALHAATDELARTEFSMLVKSAAAAPEGDREHLWFEVRAIEADRVTGELINEPVEASDLRRGAIVTIDREAVTDWRVMTTAGAFGPADTLPRPDGAPRWAELRRTLDLPTGAS